MNKWNKIKIGTKLRMNSLHKDYRDPYITGLATVSNIHNKELVELTWSFGLKCNLGGSYINYFDIVCDKCENKDCVTI